MDPSAAELYVKYGDEMTRFAAALVGPSGAADVAGAALMAVFAGSSWATVTDLRPYLFRAVLNEARSQHRSTRRRLHREVEHARRAGEPMSGFVRVEVLDAIARLTVRQRAVVFCTYWLDDDVATIAHQLGVSTRTVERELTTARRLLEVLLA